MVAIPFETRYAQASQLDARCGLFLAAAVASDTGSKEFFSGALVRPRRVAGMLRSLMDVVQARYHIPAAMLARVLAHADPVVTSSDDRLRFEGFSACCGVYVRVDLQPRAVAQANFGRGTTNVDFNPPMLAALARVRDREHVRLSVATDSVKLQRNADTVVEKKVELPIRWIRGLTEVQACQSRMTPVFDVTGPEAWRFLRAFPRMKTNRRESFVVESSRTLRLSQLPSKTAVRVGGLERLRVLEDLTADAERLQIFQDQETGASGWHLQFDDSHFHLILSPEVWRGFSGEGQVLQALAAAARNSSADALVRRVRSELKGQSVIDEEDLHRRLAKTTELASAQLRTALAVLATQGLVGFDLATGTWFHRELPFDLDSIHKHHPRLKDATKLLAEKKVRLVSQSKTDAEVLVASGNVEHRVRLNPDGPRCTCPWYARHPTGRGPCKHILAAQIFLEEAREQG